MKDLIKRFKARIREEGRTFKWFHKTYIKDISYVYFIIQLHDQDRLHDSVKTSLEKYMAQK